MTCHHWLPTQLPRSTEEGMQILLYGFYLDLDVVAENDTEESKGSYRIREILSDDLNDLVLEDIKATEKN